MTSIIENYPIMKKHNRVQNRVIIGEHQKSMSVIIGDFKIFYALHNSVSFIPLICGNIIV